MRRFWAVLLVVLILVSLSIPSFASSDNGDTVVYVTYSGKKYHRESCGYLRSKYEITLREAVEQGYQPCSRCSPPRFNGVIEKQQQQKEKQTQTSTSKSKSAVSQTSVVQQKSSGSGKTIAEKVWFWFNIVFWAGWVLVPLGLWVSTKILEFRERRKK